MITEDYVSFETAKLLKEKGFDCTCEHQYINCSSGYPFLTDIRDDTGCYYKNSEIGEDEYSAPTLQMAMKWLRDTHGLFIHIDVIREASCWLADIQDIKGDVSIYPVKKEFPNYEEACEAAIRYCLENLI